MILHFTESVGSPRPFDPDRRRLRCLSSETPGRQLVEFADPVSRNPAENGIEPSRRIDAIEFGLSFQRPSYAAQRPIACSRFDEVEPGACRTHRRGVDSIEFGSRWTPMAGSNATSIHACAPRSGRDVLMGNGARTARSTGPRVPGGPFAGAGAQFAAFPLRLRGAEMQARALPRKAGGHAATCRGMSPRCPTGSARLPSR